MNTKHYETPGIEILSVDAELILCVSGSGPLQLPDVTWKDETDW